MLILEIFNTDSETKEELDYDLKDDLVYFMVNDPEFYRKRYYPVMLKFNKYCKNGKTIEPRAFSNLVNDAYEIYKEKFPSEKLDEVLDNETCKEICEFIHEQEETNCKNDFYD